LGFIFMLLVSIMFVFVVYCFGGGLLLSFLFLFLLLLMRKILLLPTWYVVLIDIIRGSKYATEYDWSSIDDSHYLGISRLKKMGSMHGSIFMQHCWMVLLWIFCCFHCLWAFGLYRKHLLKKIILSSLSSFSLFWSHFHLDGVFWTKLLSMIYIVVMCKLKD